MALFQMPPYPASNSSWEKLRLSVVRPISWTKLMPVCILHAHIISLRNNLPSSFHNCTWVTVIYNIYAGTFCHSIVELIVLFGLFHLRLVLLSNNNPCINPCRLTSNYNSITFMLIDNRFCIVLMSMHIFGFYCTILCIQCCIT